jgi:hypothetical protein
MAEFDQGFKMIAETTGRQLAQLAGVESATWRPAESTVQASIEKLADRVFLARRGRERFAVYFEFYTTWDRNAPWEMLAKSGLISQREHLPTVCIAVVLRRQRFRSVQGQLRLQVAGNPTQHLWFKEVCLWTLKPEPWWENEPGLMALYPLCEHGRRPHDAITYAANVIESRVTGEVELGDALYHLHVFGGLAYSRLDVAAIIGREKMKSSRFAQELQQEARRADILRFLRARFGMEPPADLALALDAVNDSERLETLVDLAATCADLTAFRAGLQTQTTSSVAGTSSVGQQSRRSTKSGASGGAQ